MEISKEQSSGAGEFIYKLSLVPASDALLEIPISCFICMISRGKNHDFFFSFFRLSLEPFLKDVAE